MSKATITIEGFIANELEVRNAGEHRVVDVSVPHTPSKRNESGEWEDSGPTTWFSATFWNEHADELLSSVEKGSLVILSGMPELETYAKRDGTPGGKVKVMHPVIARVVRRPKRGGGASAGDSWAASAPADSEASGGVWGGGDETPF